MKIEKIMPERTCSGLDLVISKVLSKNTIMTRFGKKQVFKYDALDETGVVILCFWKEDPDLERGDRVRILAGYTNMYMNIINVNINDLNGVKIMRGKAS